MIEDGINNASIITPLFSIVIYSLFDCPFIAIFIGQVSLSFGIFWEAIKPFESNKLAEILTISPVNQMISIFGSTTISAGNIANTLIH